MQIGFLDLYSGVLNVRQERSSLIADNIANADTPGYKATDVSFQQALAAQLGDPSSSSAPLYRTDSTVGLDGNDVNLDGERVEATENAEQTEAAATFLHQATSDLITALHPNPSGD
jgi:flagellar basal-body rod protein FlgB